MPVFPGKAGKTGENGSFMRIYRKNLAKFVDFFKIMIIIIFRMDMQKSKVAAAISRIPVPDGCKVVVGAKQLRKALTAGRAYQVYLALDADPAITEPFEALCQNSRIAYTWVKSMTDLGSACGIEVGAATAAVIH